MMTMRLTPAAGDATLRFSVKEQSPKISAEAVVAVRRRARPASVRIGASYGDSRGRFHAECAERRRGSGFSASPRPPREPSPFTLKHLATFDHYMVGISVIQPLPH